jgi:AmmeMemoRadiSam system protein B
VEETNMREQIRQPQVAGMFYPGNPKTLSEELDNLLNAAKEKSINGEIVAIVSPHAGYMYSGLVAAYAYRLLKGKKYETVVIVSPNHREYFTEISVYEGKAYQTPLGIVEIDRALAEELVLQDRRIILSSYGHRAEHAVEVHIPFLQKILNKFKIVPIVMGDQTPEQCEILGKALGNVLIEKSALIVASSDLSHYYNDTTARKLDQIVIDNVSAFDDKKLGRDLEKRNCEACGGGPIVVAMIASKLLGADTSDVLLYRNSGDVTQDKSEVVGYMSAVFYKRL